MKICPKCKLDKDNSEYHSYYRTNSKNLKICYLQSYCKECANKTRVEHHQKFREQYRKNNLKHYHLKGKIREKNKRLNNREAYIWKTAKKRAEKLKIPFNIKISDIIIPECCPLLGIKFNLNVMKKGDLTAPSLDKIIPELGYVQNNIRIISKKANLMKSNASVGELLLFSHNIKKYLKQ
jgi:hypothetical protein